MGTHTTMVLLLLALACLGCGDDSKDDSAAPETDADSDSDADTDTDTDSDADTDVPPYPVIEVSPPSVDFGEVLALTESQAELTIANTGGRDLQLTNLELQRGDQGFSIGSIATVLLAPGAQVPLTMSFRPTGAGDAADQLQIDSDDPNQPAVQVPVTGVGVAPSIEADPCSYDFGTLCIGDSSELTVTVSNLGNTDLQIDSYSFNTGSNDLSLDPREATNGVLPWILAPGASMELTVVYSPADTYDDIAYMHLMSDDPRTGSLQCTYDGAATSCP